VIIKNVVENLISDKINWLCDVLSPP